jgi:putative membrane protein
MRSIAQVLVALVAIEHLGFLVLEMFLWARPFGLRTFGHSAEDAVRTRALAQNQGLYNGFLAAGLALGLWRGDPVTLFFFLGCVVVAGIFGAATASAKILFLQAVPGALALAALWAAR